MAGAAPTPRVAGIRRKLHMTQRGFAQRYRIPLETVRAWERGTEEPDEAHDAYLTIISREPEIVANIAAEAAEKNKFANLREKKPPAAR